MLCPYCQDNVCPLIRNWTIRLGQLPSSPINFTEDGSELSTTRAQITTWARDGCPLGKFLLENVIRYDVTLPQNPSVSDMSDIEGLEKQIVVQQHHDHKNAFSNTSWDQGQLIGHSPNARTKDAAKDVKIMVKTFRGLMRGELYKVNFYFEDEHTSVIYKLDPGFQVERGLAEGDICAEVFTDSGM